MVRHLVAYEDLAESSASGHVNGANGNNVGGGDGLTHGHRSANGKQPHWTEDGKPISASAARRYRRVIQLLACGEIIDAEQLLTRMETAIENVEIKEALAWAKRKADEGKVVSAEGDGDDLQDLEGGQDSSGELYQEDEEEEEEDAEEDQIDGDGIDQSAIFEPDIINVTSVRPPNGSHKHDAVWDDSALIDAWDAALEEYHHFNVQRDAERQNRRNQEKVVNNTGKRPRTEANDEASSPFVSKKHSKLWHEPPPTSSMLNESPSELAKRKAEVLSLLGQTDNGEATPLDAPVVSPGKRTMKGVRPPSSHIPGNPAWLSACAVVSKTPNEIGDVSTENSISAGHEAAAPSQPSTSSSSGQEDVLQNLAMAWYYAGYYQAMALSAQMQK